MLFAVPVTGHDGLKNGGEGCDSDAGRNQHGVLGLEDVARRSTVRTVDDDLQKYHFHSYRISDCS